MEKSSVLRRLKNVDKELHLIMDELQSEKSDSSELSNEDIQEFNRIVSKSKLSEEDAIELGRSVNKSLHEKYKKLLSES